MGWHQVVKVDENKTFPRFHANWNQAVLCAIEILHAFELRHSFQRSIEAIVPAVIRTMQNRSLAARLSYDGSSVVPADVVKGPQGAVVAADDHDRLSGDSGTHELSRRFYLISARDQLPGLAVYAQALEVSDAGIDVPGCRNGRGLRQRSTVVIAAKDLLDGRLHGLHFSYRGVQY